MKKWTYKIMAIFFIVSSVSWQALGAVDCQKVYNNIDLEYNLNNKPASAKCCVDMCGGVGGLDNTGACCCGPRCAGDDPSTEPTEPQNCEEEIMCCFDEPEYYDKHPDCCELNDKYEFVASYYEDSWGDLSKLRPESQCCIKDEPKNVSGQVTKTCCEGLMGSYRNGNVWAGSSSSESGNPSSVGDGDEACCKQGYPYNYAGEMTGPCCELYGTELKFDKPDNTHEQTDLIKHCHFYEDNTLNVSACCVKGSRRLCDSNSEDEYRGAPSFICCYAAQGEVWVKVKDEGTERWEPAKGNIGTHKNIEHDSTAWKCCTTFGYRGVGATDCTPKDGVTSDFDDIDCSKVVSNYNPNYNLEHRAEATACCQDFCGSSGFIDDTGTCCCSPGCGGG